MSSSIPDFEALLVPMQLDAFVLNPAVCGTGAQDDTTAHICPITQPNYTFLRLDSFVIQSDVQNHADVHNTAPASINPRLTDLGGLPEPKPLRHRHGVYIHWTLPRVYRSGVSSGEAVPESRRRYERARRGFKTAAPRSGQDATGANDTPDFVDPPTRWIVVRKIDVESIQPTEAKADFANREYEAWVVQSDYLWSLEDIPLDLDLQTDLAPFVTGHAGGDIKIEEQAEVFIGRKTPLADWSGQEDPNAQPPSISLLRSGNQLFADFQMHNSNVFSVLDNFEYGSPKDPKYLSYAKASYYVFGWHWKQEADPLWESGETIAHGASLDSLFMSLKGLSEGADDPWLEAQTQLRILCHGSMYNVTWDHENKPKEVPADQYNARLRDQVQAAISVGTTPMDSLLTYCHARRDQSDRPGDIEKLEEDILALESLLLARDDGVEGQREAKDSIYNWSFARSPGGTRYFFSEPENSDQGGPKQPLEPDTESKLQLRELNQTQRLLDACNMTVMQYRWDMFSIWWKYFSDLQKQDVGNQDTNRDAATLDSRITALDRRIKELQQRVDNLLHPTDGRANLLEKANTASEPVFYHANDPTVLVGGIPSGWPDDYLDKVSVRGPFQVISPKDDAKLPEALNKLCSLVQGKVPTVFQMPASELVTEFYLLRPEGDDSGGTPPEGKFFPQFHDQLNSDERWRDQWGDRQPWFPLFAEWEAEYRHIPFDYWKLDEHTARLSADELVRYGISVPPKDGKTPPLWEAILRDQIAGQADMRVLSGRVLILPQPSFSLGAKIMQLFQNTPPDILDQYLPEADRNNLLTNITQLSYLSAPLSGMTSGIVTQAEGSHIKPENKVIDSQGGESSAVLDAAVITAAGLTGDRIKLIQGNSALTPYSTLANFGDNEYCPFKPVTHGQFRFRKFNIIDKFGQALVAIDQKPRPEGPPPIYPCISDFYEPQTVKLDDGKTYANTVIQDNSDQCEFLQVPPQINQNVRLNSNFVKRIADDPPEERRRLNTGTSPDSAKWRPATEWEMPIWGWVITNYADYGIQLFLPDGTFYREVRFGGPLGALQSPKWLPFSPNDTPPTPDTRQLDALVNKLVDPEYLRGFWYMVTTAQDKLPPAPSAYAQFLNSIVGKPLALVNTGWSLELDGPPLQIQSKEGKVNEPERLLTPPSNDNNKKPFYQFQVRLGNRDAGYDGLVGYFDTTTPGSDELNLDAIRTFFAPEKDMKPLKRLDTNSYPLFTPFWEQPIAVDGGNQSIEPGTFVDQRNAQMSIYGAIVDPFTPVHAYSSILPPIPLSLPPWSWQKAMDTMTAFFHAGPLTLPINDVPVYDESQKLTTQNARDVPNRDLPLPPLGTGDWSWFQPYAEPPSTTAGGDDAEQATYNPFGIEKRGDLTKPGFQDGPYVAIEGFLQLRNPVMMPNRP